MGVGIERIGALVEIRGQPGAGPRCGSRDRGASPRARPSRPARVRRGGIWRSNPRAPHRPFARHRRRRMPVKTFVIDPISKRVSASTTAPSARSRPAAPKIVAPSATTAIAMPSASVWKSRWCVVASSEGPRLQWGAAPREPTSIQRRLFGYQVPWAEAVGKSAPSQDCSRIRLPPS
jgi:hypothetical protein